MKLNVLTSKNHKLRDFRLSHIKLINLYRVKNKTLDKIYAKSKDLDRKEEFNKGTS